MNYGQVLSPGWMCFCMVYLAVWYTVECWHDEKTMVIVVDGTVLTILLGIIISIMNLV